MKLGILFAICQLILLQCSAQVLILEIGQIQGEGLFSPYLGQRVSTLNNVVTAITSDGFYIQSPGIRHDQNPNTSDAIKVFTGNRPQLDTNAVVSVTGTISEINDLTQFRGEDLDIQLITGFIPLPEPVILDKNFPSPIETAPPDLEKVEGMLIEFNALATGPKIGAADIPVTTQPERSFREPGIRFPGIQGLPVWDGNPELFWISPTESDSNSLNFVNALTTITCSRALLTQSGDRYLAFPQSSLALTPAVNTESIRSKKADEWTVGSLNLLMLDHSDPFFEIKASKTEPVHSRPNATARYPCCPGEPRPTYVNRTGGTHPTVAPRNGVPGIFHSRQQRFSCGLPGAAGHIGSGDRTIGKGSAVFQPGTVRSSSPPADPATQ